VLSFNSLSIVDSNLRETSWFKNDAEAAPAAEPLWISGAVDTTQAIVPDSQVMNWVHTPAFSKDIEISGTSFAFGSQKLAN
jgi:hypothetical protein